MTNSLPVPNPSDSGPLLRLALEDLQNRISFMRDVVRGDCEPFESPDEWLEGLAKATWAAEKVAQAVLDDLRAVGRQWDFGGRSYASDAEALIGFARRIVVGDYHDPLAPLPILNIGQDGCVEDPRVLKMNRIRLHILMAEGLETLAAQVTRSCSVTAGRELSACLKPLDTIPSPFEQSRWRRAFTALKGRDDYGPRRLWRVLSRMHYQRPGRNLGAAEACGWDYRKGKIPSNLMRDRDDLMEHKVDTRSVMIKLGEPADSYRLEVPLPVWLLEELDAHNPGDSPSREG